MKFKDFEIMVYSIIWVVTWFAAIWIQEFRWQLFLTGLFCLMLGMIVAIGRSKRK